MITDAIRIKDLSHEATEWRWHLHAQPELGFELLETSGFVEERLRAFGCDQIDTGIAETGFVALIEGRRGEGPTLGLRADMDALPIHEATGIPQASRNQGRMHACGHDGHTAMLLGAAALLAEHRDFRGRVALIFQPAEEHGGGGEVMVRHGITDRYEIDEVSRIEGGNSYNIIPDEVRLSGTIRALSVETLGWTRERIGAICHGTSLALGAELSVAFIPSYPARVNHDRETNHAVAAARAIAGTDAADSNTSPSMGGVDFSYMLQARPGALMPIGNGATADLHNPSYDFNDSVMAYGNQFWVKLAEDRLGTKNTDIRCKMDRTWHCSLGRNRNLSDFGQHYYASSRSMM